MGTYIYTLGEKEIGRVPIITARAVEKAGYVDYLNELWTQWAI